jgi:hypothetical protein
MKKIEIKLDYNNIVTLERIVADLKNMAVVENRKIDKENFYDDFYYKITETYISDNQITLLEYVKNNLELGNIYDSWTDTIFDHIYMNAIDLLRDTFTEQMIYDALKKEGLI